LLHLPPLLRLERQRGSGAGKQARDADRFAGFFTETVVAAVDAGERLLHLLDQLALAIARAQLERVNSFIECGVREGADRIVCFDGALPDTGYWVAPTLFRGVQPAHTIAREEIFGPVLTVLTFRTPDEAIARANDTNYGLSAGVWTSRASKAYEVAAGVKAGVVWLNTFNQFDATSPFGGFKESGFGREGGRAGLAAYLA
jgi:acyl-CoA reductase-like NAD-dependent aldehyde dehydrogenase